MNEIPLRRWQQDAVTRWVRSGGSGIIEAATGSGKTRVALAAIAVTESVWEADLRVAVVVPTRALMYQWRQRFREFGLWTVDLLGDGHHATGTAPTTIAVINSAREHLPALLKRWRREDKVSMLVVDECHRAGSPSNAQIFEGPIDFTLGISATPHRDGDTATETVIIPALGDVIMTYTRADAESDGVVSPVDLIDIFVKLEDFERHEYSELTSKIDSAKELMLQKYPFLFEERDLVRAVGDLKHRQYREGEVDPVLEIWTTAIMNRRRLLARSKNRRKAAEDLLRSLPRAEQGYLFHEQISEAEQTYELLKDEEIAVGLFHSKLDKEIQEHALSGFRAGKLRWLSCVRALDEGIDTPNATTAVIVAGTYSKRQLIQRLGRVSRPHGGDRAVAYRILVENEIERAPNIGGRHATVSWPEGLSTILDRSLIEASLSELPTGDHDLYDDEDDDLDFPVWSKDANPDRNLMIPVVDRVLQANIVTLAGEVPVSGPARAVERARWHVREAWALLSQLEDAADTPYLGSGWPDRLRRSSDRLRTQLTAGRAYTPTRFHAARTKAGHDLKDFDSERIRAGEMAQSAADRRWEQVRRSLEGKKGEQLLEAHASGHPVDVYVNDIVGNVAHVTVRRTLITSRIDLPPGYNWLKNTIQSVRVVEFDRKTGALSLEAIGN